jgi:hypothetical protein
MQVEETTTTPLVVSLVDPCERTYSLKLTSTDLPIELKSLLADFAETSTYTNYHFECLETLVNDYEDLGRQAVAAGSRLKMVIDPYTERDVKQHVSRLLQVLICPPSKTSPVVSGPSSEDMSFFEGPVEASMPDIDFTQLEPDPAKLSNPPSKLHPFRVTETVLPQCLRSIVFSRFSPSDKRRLRGDIAYLLAYTLEDTVVPITASAKGFYVNASSFEGQLEVLNPEPAERRAEGKTLVELLSEVSPLFKASFGVLLNSGHDWNNLQTASLPDGLNDWVYSTYKRQPYEPEFDALRDWNEELQIVRSIPVETPKDRISRDKGVFRVYRDFLEAAVNSAKAVVHGSIAPLNPMDLKVHQVYVMNHIFLSFTQDLGYKVELKQ